MKTTTDPMSILVAYSNYRNNLFFVNRIYQRKLVWSTSEKELLIDSILRGYALPSLLFSKDEHKTVFEILDGVQRLSSIFEFIENKISVNGKYFDIDSFPYAKSLRDKGVFNRIEIDKKLTLSTDECTKFLNYTLSINTITASSDETIDLFRRINSQGHTLSNQDRRRSGVVSDFVSLVDDISTSLRGDISKKRVNLTDMPKISLDDQRSQKGYGVSIEDTFWFKTGVLRRDNIKKSEDEEFVADLAASIISGSPFSASQENFNKLYDTDSPMAISIATQLRTQGKDKIEGEMKTVFSFISNTLIKNRPNKGKNFQQVVSSSKKNRNPSKYAFYAFYMAFYDLIYRKNKVPSNFKNIWARIDNLESKLSKGSHSVNVEERKSNIALVEGLIAPGFVTSKDELKNYSSGQLLINILTDGNGENERFEFKIGLYTYDPNKKVVEFNNSLIGNIAKKATTFANTPGNKSSYIMIGVADSENDIRYLSKIGIPVFRIGNVLIVGVERDLKLANKTIDEYYQKYFSAISKQPISNNIKNFLMTPKTYTYNGAKVLVFEIKNTGTPEAYDGKFYQRNGTNTQELNTSELIKVTQELTKK